MNIAEILKKYAKKGDIFYSVSCGDLEFCFVQDNNEIVMYYNGKCKSDVYFDEFGKLEDEGECLLFPSKECRDWNEYVRLKEDVEVKVGDHVLYDGEQYIIMKIDEDEARVVNVVYGWTKCVFLKELTTSDMFDHTMLRPFDRVLVRDTDADYWKANFFSHIRPKEERCDDESGEYKYSCVEDAYCECIPYNDETKHLVGTTNEAPEFYR